MDKRYLIPTPYFTFGVLTFGAFAVFATLFALFLVGIPVMNPWVNIVYLISSLGLFSTDVAAIIEWKSGKLRVIEEVNKIPNVSPVPIEDIEEALKISKEFDSNN